MQISSLTVEDMKSLLQFASEIYASGSGYLDTTLKLLESLFGYKMTAVSCVDDIDGQKEISIYAKGNGLSSEFLHHTQLLNLSNDSMFKLADNASKSNDWNGVFYMQDVHENQYSNKEYLDYLKDNNIKCYAKLIIDRSPLLSIHVCKGYNEDYFDLRERALLSYISRILSAIAARERELFDKDVSLISAQKRLNSLKKGLLVYSSKRHYMHYNEQFIQFAHNHSPGISASSYMMFLTRSIEDMLHLSIDDIYDEFQCIIEGNHITITPELYTGINNKPERFLAITITGNDDVDSAPDVSKIQKYRLTKRESEIIQMVMQGSTSKQIAAALSISLPTVKTHIASIYSKLGVTNKVEALNKLRR